MTDLSAQQSDTPRLLPDALSGNAEFGDYTIGRLLGRGGMGVVYQALHRDTHRQVALKLLTADINMADSRERFLREGRAAAAVNHPNTVYVYRTEEIEGTPVICMELVADGTLEERVKNRGPLPVHEVVEYAVQMIDGLAAAYGAGLLHRDIKPSNCFVSEWLWPVEGSSCHDCCCCCY